MTPYSQLRNGPRIDLAKAHPLAAPLTIQIEPTNVCNFGCVMCPQSFEDFAAQSGYHQAMPLDLYKKMIREMAPSWRLKSLRLYGVGEPTLNPNLAKMVELGKTVAERVEVTTNGTRLTKHFDLISAGLDYLQVSIYSVDESRHARITGRPKIPPSEILRNVREFRAERDGRGSERPFIYARLISDTERGELDFCRTWAREADEIGVQYRHNWGGLVRPEDITAREYYPNIDGAATEFRHQKCACPFPFYLMYVHANGLVSACCIDWTSRLIIGDLREERLEQIWNGSRMASIRAKHMAGRREDLGACAGCDALHSTPDNIDSLIREVASA